jgi:hypothetical protein
MKLIKILGFLVFLTILFLQTFDAYGHLVCQSERDDLTVAERNLDFAQRDVRAQNLKIDLMWIDEFLEGPPSDPTFAFKVIDEEKKLKEYEKIRDDAQGKVNDARAARDRCIANDIRDCPGDCSKLHTQAVTSCECNCARWLSPSNRGCDCGDCSADLN